VRVPIPRAILFARDLRLFVLLPPEDASIASRGTGAYGQLRAPRSRFLVPGWPQVHNDSLSKVLTLSGRFRIDTPLAHLRQRRVA